MISVGLETGNKWAPSSASTVCSLAHSLLHCLINELAVRSKSTWENGTGSMHCHFLCPTGSTQKAALRAEREKIRANSSCDSDQTLSYPNIRTKYKCTQMHNREAANTSETANKASCWDKLFANKETLNIVIYSNPQSHALSRTAHTNDNKTVENCNAVCLKLLWICNFL